ncbi:hypothetical protein [Profundibacter amoris]|uniref:Uncharacterized protein n=1 Tax=Profundibacter amoris TaxID=2171755 RepID=A0A347UD57_9RHOB|nr:hypothetical protein [Profundibacter amoris]AXX96785.1 hypothetical protein BAR1_01855 [Profundibacter amoris]
MLCEGGQDVCFETPQAAPEWQADVIRKGSNLRETTTDPQTGTTTLHIVDDFGARKDADHVLITDSVARECWVIHPDDPLSARGRTHWCDILQRVNWCLRTETYSHMWADAANFHLSARIEAYEGDRLVFEKDFTETIPRDMI